MMEKESFKIAKYLVEILRKRKPKTGQTITWQIEEAVKRDLKRKP